MALPYDTRIGSLASILPTSRRTSGTAACAEPPSNNGSLNNVTEAAAPAVARKCRRVTCFFILSSLREPDRDSRRLPIRCTHAPLSYVIVRPRSSSLHPRTSRVSKVPFLNFPCSAFIRLHLSLLLINRPDVLYHFVCYLEPTSLTAAPRLPLSPLLPSACALFFSLCALFPTPVLCFQQLPHSFCKTPGGVATPTLPHQASLPPSHAPRGASIPCGLCRLCILPVTTGVCTPTCFRLLLGLWPIPLARPLFSYSLAPICEGYKSLFPPARDGWL